MGGTDQIPVSLVMLGAVLILASVVKTSIAITDSDLSVVFTGVSDGAVPSRFLSVIVL